MRTWEYKTILLPIKYWYTVKIDEEEYQKQLNQLGGEGWELVTGHPTSAGGNTNTTMLIFKRELLLNT